jgi:RNA polymerase sigma-70 factor (ECF subfamily)
MLKREELGHRGRLMRADQTTVLQRCLDRLQAGDETGRAELIERAQQRLRQLTRKMLKDFPRLRPWEEPDDVFQGALLRLCRALQVVTPPSVRAFFRLAAVQVRRELIDLARHYFGPEGLAARLAVADGSAAGPDPSDPTLDPQRLAVWTEFHCQVERLPEEEREVFDLLWYQELTQAEAAALLGVDVRTIKRRWQSARLILHEALRGHLPGMK